MMSLKMGLIFIVLILACLPSSAWADSQGDALFGLRTSLGASPDQLTDWNSSQVNPCNWSYVQCDSNNNVINVTLPSMGFTGTLSPKIAILNNLKILALPGNGITGEIPKEFGNLTSLTNLDLSNNNLTGEIPSSLGKLKMLRYLTLNQNNLIGTIPKSLPDIPNLVRLMLNSNNLSGQVPEPCFQVKQYNFSENRLDCGDHPCVSLNNRT